MKAEEEKAKEAQKKTKGESDSARLAREKAEADKKAAANGKSGQLKQMHVNRKGGDTEKFVENYIDKVVELGQNEDEADQED